MSSNAEKYGTKYLVCDEHTLCYAYPNQLMMGVLAGSVIRGGHNPMSGCVFPSQFRTIRDATVEDFKFFRVSHKGHIAD
jgi:hypothetical protein